MRHQSLAVLPLLALLGACPAQSPQPVSYPKTTTLLLATSRCAGKSCSCRPLDSYEGQAEEQIPPGMKRFELRLPRTTSELWVEVQGKGVFHKPAEAVDPACLYIDLPRGQTKFVVHSVRTDREIGLQTGLRLLEYGPKDGPHWYPVFELACGGTNRCTKKGLAAWVDFMRALPRQIFNPCSSVRIRGVSVSGTRERKIDLEYIEMTARFTLDVYDFETYKDPAAAECRGAARE